MEKTRELIEGSRGEAVRLQDIAQAAGVSRQAIYLHFDSRADLMVATVQYIDRSGGLMERTQHVRDEEDGRVAVSLFIDVWAEYVPTIYPMAKQLLILRETDEAAAAAWQDRMEGFRNGVCRYLIERLEEEGHLASQWQTDTAIDLLWTLLSIQTWESLVIARGWSEEQYAKRVKQIVEDVLIATP